MPTSILGLAHVLPPRQTVGSQQRPILADPGGPADLALAPAQAALAQAGLSVDELGMVLFATMTPDATFPGAACFFQDKLGCGTTAALDVRGQCAGFLTGLQVADAFLEAGVYETILLAAGEVHSPRLDFSPRGIAVAELYGDGAAVAVLGGRDGAGLEAIVCHADGRHHERFWVESPASRQHPQRITAENIRDGLHYPRLDRDHLEEFALDHLPAVVREALAQGGVGVEDVDAFILSHILPGVAARAVEALGVPAARFIDAGEAHGHLTAATLPVALSEALAAGRLARGARVCLAACGAGYTWGAAVLRL